jgi:hypothetical protein
MSIGIGNEHEISPLQVVLGANEVLRVLENGQFVWSPDADRMIEEGNFSDSPAWPHILRALRKREWVGLTDEERMDILLNLNWDKKLSHMDTALAIEAKLKEKNT